MDDIPPNNPSSPGDGNL